MTILSDTKFSFGAEVSYQGSTWQIIQTGTETVLKSDGTIRYRQETYKIKQGDQITTVDVGALKEVKV